MMFHKKCLLCLALWNKMWYAKNKRVGIYGKPERSSGCCRSRTGYCFESIERESGYVSEEKKKMILKAAEELHYRQNMSVPEPAEHHAGLAAKGKQVSLVFLYRIWNSRFLQVF